MCPPSMKAFVRKLRNNLLNARVPRVLGWRQYLTYLGLLTRHLPDIARRQNLKPVDEAVGSSINTYRYRGRAVRFDCGFGDRRIAAGAIDNASYSFGYVREILFRDCYFRHHPQHVYENARVVLDLGVNAGVFAALMTPVAEFIVGVEVNEALIPVAEHNLRLNGFERFALECGFVGRGGLFDDGRRRYLGMQDLIGKYALQRIDLLKADIEGSEYALFEAPGWLDRVGAISMEVHRYPGQEALVDTIRRCGFQLALADQDLQPVARIRDAEFLYAWK